VLLPEFFFFPSMFFNQSCPLFLLINQQFHLWRLNDFQVICFSDKYSKLLRFFLWKKNQVNQKSDLLWEVFCQFWNTVALIFLNRCSFLLMLLSHTCQIFVLLFQYLSKVFFACQEFQHGICWLKFIFQIWYWITELLSDCKANILNVIHTFFFIIHEGNLFSFCLNGF